MLCGAGGANHRCRRRHELPDGRIIVSVFRHDFPRHGHPIRRRRRIDYCHRNFHGIGRIVGGIEPQHIIPCFGGLSIQLAIPVIGGRFCAHLPTLGRQQGLHIICPVKLHHELPFPHQGVLHVPVAIPVIGVPAGQGKEQGLIASFQVKGRGDCLDLSIAALPFHKKAVTAFLHPLLMIPQAVP